MAVNKVPVNKDKTKYKWKVVAYIPTNNYNSQGKPIYKHHYIGLYEKEREARQAEREFLNKLEAGKVERNKNATVSDILTYFIDSIKTVENYSKGTVKNYECLQELHLNTLKDVQVSRVSKEIIRRWRQCVKEKGLSCYRINDCVKLLKAAFNYAINDNVISFNPFAGMKSEKVPKKLRKRFSTKQLKELLYICKVYLPDYYCLFALSCLTGMRVGEYTALCVEDIDFENNLIAVHKQYTAYEHKKDTKTIESTRFVHPSDETLNIIRWHVQRFNITTGLLFPNAKGSPVSAKWVSRRFQKLLTMAGFQVDYCRVHDLRGQYVDIQHSIGTPTEQISREVGHSRISTTSDIYTQILDEIPAEVNKRLDEKFFGKRLKIVS